MRKLLTVTVLLTMIFAGCAGQSEKPAVSADEPKPTVSVQDPNENDVVVTVVPEKPTATPVPTATPKPTPTPVPHEHSYVESITKEATCTDEGTKSFVCECGDAYTEAIAKLEHTYVEVEGSAVAATCEADGKGADKACVCGDLIVGEKIASTGHDFGEYKSDKNATYEADGTKTATCALCGDKDTVTDKGSKLEKPKEPNLYGMEFKESNPQVPVYCMEDTDVYFEPSFQSEVIGHLFINEEVKWTGWANNYNAGGNKMYPPYDKTEKPKDLYWYRINYNGQIGYIPSDYVCKSKRDTSVKLNPLYANYPTVNGGGSGLFYPYSKEWRYVYGSATTLTLNPNLSEMKVYDGINMNVIDVVTDSSIVFNTTGNAYIRPSDDNGIFRLREIYYNGKLAYVSERDARWTVQ